jgi:ketosteroid isomerase-like protein
MTSPSLTDGSGAGPAMFDLLERLNQGFARHDVKQVLDLFFADPGIVFIGSEADETATGPVELRTLLERLFARPETYQWRWGEARARVTGQVAWLATEAVLVVDGSEQQQQLPYRITLVLRRHGERWVIAHYHGSEPVAVAEQYSAPTQADIAAGRGQTS